METIRVFTDGGCSGNPGPGAWAFLILAPSGEIRRSSFEPLTTNNRMELSAVIEALRELKQRELGERHAVEVTTDSQYVQQGITRWICAWESNGWKTSSKKPVKNQDLWIELRRLTGNLRITWHWVMGHSGDGPNEECHAMVEAVIRKSSSP